MTPGLIPVQNATITHNDQEILFDNDDNEHLFNKFNESNSETPYSERSLDVKSLIGVKSLTGRPEYNKPGRIPVLYPPLQHDDQDVLSIGIDDEENEEVVNKKLKEPQQKSQKQKTTLQRIHNDVDYKKTDQWIQPKIHKNYIQENKERYIAQRPDYHLHRIEEGYSEYQGSTEKIFSGVSSEGSRQRTRSFDLLLERLRNEIHDIVDSPSSSYHRQIKQYSSKKTKRKQSTHSPSSIDRYSLDTNTGGSPKFLYRSSSMSSIPSCVHRTRQTYPVNEFTSSLSTNHTIPMLRERHLKKIKGRYSHVLLLPINLQNLDKIPSKEIRSLESDRSEELELTPVFGENPYTNKMILPMVEERSHETNSQRTNDISSSPPAESKDPTSSNRTAAFGNSIAEERSLKTRLEMEKQQSPSNSTSKSEGASKNYTTLSISDRPEVPEHVQHTKRSVHYESAGLCGGSCNCCGPDEYELVESPGKNASGCTDSWFCGNRSKPMLRQPFGPIPEPRDDDVDNLDNTKDHELYQAPQNIHLRNMDDVSIGSKISNELDTPKAVNFRQDSGSLKKKDIGPRTGSIHDLRSDGRNSSFGMEKKPSDVQQPNLPIAERRSMLHLRSQDSIPSESNGPAAVPASPKMNSSYTEKNIPLQSNNTEFSELDRSPGSEFQPYQKNSNDPDRPKIPGVYEYEKILYTILKITEQEKRQNRSVDHRAVVRAVLAQLDDGPEFEDLEDKEDESVNSNRSWDCSEDSDLQYHLDMLMDGFKSEENSWFERDDKESMTTLSLSPNSRRQRPASRKGRNNSISDIGSRNGRHAKSPSTIGKKIIGDTPDLPGLAKLLRKREKMNRSRDKMSSTSDMALSPRAVEMIKEILESQGRELVSEPSPTSFLSPGSLQCRGNFHPHDVRTNSSAAFVDGRNHRNLFSPSNGIPAKRIIEEKGFGVEVSDSGSYETSYESYTITSSSILSASPR